jgi:hypothetical protein
MPVPGGGSENPFGFTGGIGCTGRPTVGVADGVRVEAGGSVVATTLGVGADVGAGVMVTSTRRGTGRLQAARSINSPTRPYAHRVRGFDRAVTP